MKTLQTGRYVRILYPQTTQVESPSLSPCVVCSVWSLSSSSLPTIHLLSFPLLFSSLFPSLQLLFATFQISVHFLQVPPQSTHSLVCPFLPDSLLSPFSLSSLTVYPLSSDSTLSRQSFSSDRNFPTLPTFTPLCSSLTFPSKTLCRLIKRLRDTRRHERLHQRTNTRETATVITLSTYRNRVNTWGNLSLTR